MSQWHIMYIDKICLNWVPGGPLNFILGGWHCDDWRNKNDFCHATLVA